MKIPADRASVDSPSSARGTPTGGPGLVNAESPQRLTALRIVLVANIVYGTYQNHITVDFGIKGINLTTLLFFAAVWLTSSLKSKPTAPPPLKGFLYAFFAGLIWSFVIGQMRDSSTMMDDLTVVKNMLFAMMLYFVTYNACGDKRTRQVVFAALLGVTALVTIHVWRQAIDYGIGVYNESRRASGPFGPDARASNRAAAYFIIFLPVMLSAALYFQHWKSRLFAMVFTVLGIAGVFFTYSRQAYFVVALLFAYLAIRRNWMLALMVLALILSYESWAPQGVIDRIASTHAEDGQGEGKLDESTESRFIIWAGAGELIARNPLGIGLNHFKRSIGEFAPDYAGYDAHNNYVRYTTEGGIPGIITMVALLLAVFALSLRVLKADDSNETRLLGMAFHVSILGVILSNIYGSRFFDEDIMGGFWMLAGLAARHLAVAREEAAPPASKPIAVRL